MDEIFDLYRKEILKVLNERKPIVGMNILPQAHSPPYETHVPIVTREYIVRVKNQALPLAKSGMSSSSAVIFEWVMGFAAQVNNMIFNGSPSYDAEGIYKDAGDNFTVEKGKEWNTKDGNPYNDIISIISKLSETSRYRPKFMVLSHDAYFSLLKCNKMGVICIKMIEDAGIFPNGRKDIYRVPNSIISSGCGLIGDSSQNNIERYVQKPKYDGMKSISEDEGVYSGIYIQKPEEIDENNKWNFNLRTQQGLHIKRNDAFLRLENLIKSS